MDYKTMNYKTLEENIKTEKEALKLSNVTFRPSILIERCNNLMANFSEMYLETEENRKNLQSDIVHRSDMVLALFYSIWEQLQDAEKMLSECQSFTVESEQKSKPTDLQYAVSGNFIIKTA